MHQFKNTVTVDPGFGAAWPRHRSGPALARRWRRVQAAIVRALTLPTWWEFL